MNIYPTGTCFDDAIANLTYLMKREGVSRVKNGEFRIVHAIIHPKEEKEALAHAWIESPTSVYFSGIVDGEKILVEVNRTEYYLNANVKKAVSYTLFEAYEEEMRRGHYGPWDEEIRPLCSRTLIGKLTFRPREDQHKDN
jgi:hypothetical protein